MSAISYILVRSVGCVVHSAVEPDEELGAWGINDELEINEINEAMAVELI